MSITNEQIVAIASLNECIESEVYVAVLGDDVYKDFLTELEENNDDAFISLNNLINRGLLKTANRELAQEDFTSTYNFTKQMEHTGIARKIVQEIFEKAV